MSQQTAHSHNAVHAACHLYSKKIVQVHHPDTIKCKYSLKMVMTTNCSQVETQRRTTIMQMSFPETVYEVAGLSREAGWMYYQVLISLKPFETT